MRLMAGLVLGCGCAVGAAQAPFCAQIRALTGGSQAHWGVSVRALDGATLCAVDEAKLFRPASNAKLFTTAAALAVLGADKRLETRVTGKLDAATGVVTGDLTLVGGGDANLDSGDLPYVHKAEREKPPPEAEKPWVFRDLEELAAQLAAKGVKSVTGDVVGDDSLFPYEPYPLSWELEDVMWDYGAPVSALSIADNMMRLTVTPGKVSGRPGHEVFAAATVTLDQHGVPYYTVVSEAGTAPSKAPLSGIQFERLPGTRTLRVYGTIAEDAPPDVSEIAIDDPAAYAAMVFKGILQTHGISVNGTSRSEHKLERIGAGFLEQLRAPGDAEAGVLVDAPFAASCMDTGEAPTLATHRSAPLGEDVIFTDKVSQNLHAELLLHGLGRRVACGSGSTVAGARMVRAFLLHAGVSGDDFVFYDGSGVSSHDLTTPRAVTQLLVYAAKQPWFDGFKAALPVGGVDGSLAGRFSGDLKGRVFAKTGTLGETRALSGYVLARSGKMLAFSILDDNHAPGSSDDRALMDKLVELMVASN